MMMAFAWNALAADKLKIMSLNTEWLWTPEDHHIDGIKFNKGDMSPRAYWEELRFYQKLIERQGVRLVALSEIENKSVADDLAQLLNESDALKARKGPRWSVAFRQGRDTATGQDVALLSNLALVAGSVTDFNFPRGRLSKKDKRYKRLSKIVGARYRWRGQTVGVITAHLLSKRNDSRKKAADRQRQAVALSKAVKRFQEQNQRIILLGDLNDFSGSPTLNVIEHQTGLLDAATSKNCGSAFNKLRWQVDHVLVQGVSVAGCRLHDLKNFSDHSGLVVDID